MKSDHQRDQNPAQKTKCLLVIDNCPRTQEALSIILGSTYQILSAQTAQKGLNMLSPDINLVFLNLSLPGADGLEILKQIKKVYPSIPIIVATAFGTEEICMRAFDAGARSYIKKPFTPQEVSSKVDKLMNIAKENQERRNLFVSTTTPDKYEDYDIPSHILQGILRVKGFIEENYTETLDLAEACKMSAISKTYFSYFFKRITGYSLKGYQNHVKVRKAESLIKEKGLPIFEVAELLGYSDSNYFSTVFKKHTGISPKQLLGKNKENLGKI
ncbi:MAG: response regulator transcription factor [Nitrospirota bacterium]